MKKVLAYFCAVICAIFPCLSVACGGEEPKKLTITLDVTEIALNIGQSLQLNATCSDENTELIWSSSNSLVASVYSSGVVVGAKKGTATVTVSDIDGRASASCEITVVQPVVGVSIECVSNTVALNGNVALIARVSPSTADNSSVIWESSDERIASVDGNGVVTGHQLGEVTITVKTVDGAKTSSCKMQVVASQTTYICNGVLRNYLNANRAESYGILTNYIETEFKKSNFYDYQALSIVWQSDGSNEYTVHISENQDYSNALILTTTDTKINKGICVPGKNYYVKVVGEKGVVKTDTISIADQPIRIVNIEGVGNARDLGGYVTDGGAKVKYGMIYRGAELEGENGSRATQNGQNTLRNLLKIHTEIDLRMSSEQKNLQTNSVGFASYKWKPMYPYNFIIPENIDDKFYASELYYHASSTEYIKDIFNLLAVETNYPVYFHCVWGADRTGTLAFLINGLLGVDYDDLVRDYELTSFSHSGKRTWVVNPSNLSASTDYHLYSASDLNRMSSSNMYKLYWQIMTYYGENDGKLSTAIENYLIDACGVTKDKIQEIRNIMLVSA